MLKYIYYFTKKEIHNDILSYGIKPYELSNTVIQIKDKEKKAITCYLNPKDSIYYNDPNYKIVKILINKNLDILVANDSLDEELLINSLTPIHKYVKGSFEYPVALIFSTIPPKYISEYNKIIDYPIDYNNSNELYYNNTLISLLDHYKMNSKTTLWAILDFLHNEGLVDIIEYEDCYVYIDKKTKKIYTISID